ncbi:helix-hairpin-helix domain-containing protein [Geobacter sp. AOG1]|uniref:ComEA family DNA-binding protein n=1 Tax=Geobacter sp. AOG1 TaxID=1566346 RepID=UPI001CC620CB|nr:helix-hairpin-helix domain-containing protein [Geobacter sp. AOG1]
MTLPGSLTEQDGMCLCSRDITAGDVVTVLPGKDQHVEISLSKMSAREQMLLGIPLNPDLMDGADWEALPGIGPGLARDIVVDRHKNGEFCTIDRLERVPGIGSKRIEALRRYF